MSGLKVPYGEAIEAIVPSLCDSFSLGGGEMEPALRQLMEILPPPPVTAGRDVKWTEHEVALGITYPTWLKRLVAIYGGSIWFDNYSILYPAAECYDVLSFRKAVQEQLDLLVKYGMTDEHTFKPIQVPLYPESGGLFPFMVDYDGGYFFWRMEPSDPDKWPLLRWEVDTLRTLKSATLAEFFLEAIAKYREIEPSRVRVDPWAPPTAEQS